MKKEKVYISGPISGLERDDYMERFAIAERVLRAHGYRVCNPTRLLPSRFPWIYKIIGYKLTLMYDLVHLYFCDRAFFMPGWENSKGCKIEESVTSMLYIDTFEIGPIEEGEGMDIFTEIWNGVSEHIKKNGYPHPYPWMTEEYNK